jgi:hypothetical protein
MEWCAFFCVFLLVALPVGIAYYIGHDRGFWKGYFYRIREELETYDGVKRNP